MGRLIDSISVWLVCTAFMVVDGLSALSVAGFLGSLVVLCACQFCWHRAIRIGMLIAFLVACAFWSPLMPFLPVGACLCVFEEARAVRFAWVAAWVAVATRLSIASAFVLLMLCVAAVLLAHSIAFESRASRRMRLARDGVREQMIGLAERNRSIQLELEGRAAAVEGDDAPDPFAGLTDRERQIAALVAEGLDNRTIAERLFLSEGTVRNNISAILQKKQLKNRTQLAVLCLSQG